MSVCLCFSLSLHRSVMLGSRCNFAVHIMTKTRMFKTARNVYVVTYKYTKTLSVDRFICGQSNDDLTTQINKPTTRINACQRWGIRGICGIATEAFNIPTWPSSWPLLQRPPLQRPPHRTNALPRVLTKHSTIVASKLSSNLHIRTMVLSDVIWGSVLAVPQHPLHGLYDSLHVAFNI